MRDVSTGKGKLKFIAHAQGKVTDHLMLNVRVRGDTRLS